MHSRVPLVEPMLPAGARAVLGTAAEHASCAGLRVVGWHGDDGAVALGCDLDGHEVTASLDNGGQEFSEWRTQATCGLMGIHGRSHGRPTPIGLPYISAMVGTLAATGAAAGALAAADGAAVSRVRTSVRRSALLSVSQYLAAATAEEGAERITPAADTAGCRPPLLSSDGVRFEVEILTPEVWAAFWSGMDAPVGAVNASWRTYLLRYARALTDLDVGLEHAARRKTFAEIQTIGSASGASLCRVRGLDECRADPGLRLADPAFSPWVLSERCAGTAHLRAGRTRTASPPLAGLRVVESTRRMQGPLASLLLQLLGAEITRIEPPGGDPLRWMGAMAHGTSARFVALNHGKSVVEIDLKSRSGRAATLEAVRDADVFLHNWAPQKAAELRLDSGDMFEVNPRLVYAYASGWGDLFGDQNPPLGTDFMVQAYSGVASALAADEPAPSLMTLLDMYGGAISAGGILGGLIATRRGGSGVRVDTSLISAAAALLRLGARHQMEPCGSAQCESVDDLSTLPARYPGDFGDEGCAVVRSPWSFE